MPLPDNFSPRLYDATVGGSWRPEPPLVVADAADLLALAAIRDAYAHLALTFERARYSFDSTEVQTWEREADGARGGWEQFKAALSEAQKSREHL